MGETISDNNFGEGGLAARVDGKEGKGSLVISLHPLLCYLAANTKDDETGRKIDQKGVCLIFFYRKNKKENGRVLPLLFTGRKLHLRWCL